MKTFIKKNFSFAVLVLSLIAVRWSFADQYRVPTGSMEPTIHIGDTVFVNKSAYDLKLPYTNIVLKKMTELQRGDIVVFVSPENASMNLIKRLIGVPGDHIQIRDGFISVNGQAVSGTDEGKKAVANASLEQNEVDYQETMSGHKLTVKRTQSLMHHEDLDFVVPQDRYFFMGDNRDNSYDSRYWGFVPRENIKGQAIRVMWNISLDENFIPHSELERSGHSLL